MAVEREGVRESEGEELPGPGGDSEVRDLGGGSLGEVHVMSLINCPRAVAVHLQSKMFVFISRLDAGRRLFCFFLIVAAFFVNQRIRITFPSIDNQLVN